MDKELESESSREILAHMMISPGGKPNYSYDQMASGYEELDSKRQRKIKELLGNWLYSNMVHLTGCENETEETRRDRHNQIKEIIGSCYYRTLELYDLIDLPKVTE